MREGAARIGFDGQPVGVVTADEAEDAARCLADYMAGTAKPPVVAPPRPGPGSSLSPARQRRHRRRHDRRVDHARDPHSDAARKRDVDLPRTG